MPAVSNYAIFHGTAAMSHPTPPSSAPKNSPSEPSPGSEQPFVEHLAELRDRLVRCLAALLLVTVALAVFPGANALIDFIAQPIMQYMPEGQKLIAVGVFSPFLVPLKVLLMAALLCTLPWIMYQAWQFVAPGLYRHEKNFALPLILMGSLLALAGIAFVQFFVLGNMFRFLQAVTPAAVAATPDVASYVQAILTLYLAFALAFQVPVVVILLVQSGIVELSALKRFRRFFIVLAFVIAAIVTPPDVVSQIALAIPMALLYEVGLLLANYFKNRHSNSDSDSDRHSDSTHGSTHHR